MKLGKILILVNLLILVIPSIASAQFVDLLSSINFQVIGIGTALMLIVGLIIIFWYTRRGKSGHGGKNFPVIVTIFEARAGNIIEDYDTARRIEETEKGTVIELKKRKKKIPPIPLNYLHIDKKGSSHLKLYTPDNERFYPVKFDFEESEPRFLEEKEWDIVDYRTSVKLRELFHKPSFIEKWGNILYLLIFGMMLMIAMYVVLGRLSDILSITGNAVTISRDALDIAKQIVTAIHTNSTIGTVAPPY